MEVKFSEAQKAKERVLVPSGRGLRVEIQRGTHLFGDGSETQEL